MKHNKSQRGEASITFLIMVLFIAVACISISVVRSFSVGAGQEHVITATVTDKNIKRINDEDIYLIYTETEDGETVVMQITDSFIAGRFNSSDVYAGIKVGKKYEFTTRGERKEFFSWYPNIYEYKEV